MMPSLYCAVRRQYLRLPFWFQALLVGMLVAVLALAVTDVVDNWSDWVVLGVIVFTTIAVAFTVYNRQYPTKKRTFTRDSDSKW
jgi:drug/metabolite transporter (DMT)-like permease